MGQVIISRNNEIYGKRRHRSGTADINNKR
jgi:hypothetical protein